jgi:hypothetical protein
MNKVLQNTILTLILLAIFAYSAWIIKSLNLYKSGDSIGYNLGLVGGILMLVLLTYPLRKRFDFMRRLGEMRYWFAFHMFCGIAGPLLIIYHSTFRLGSTNAQVAFYSMVVVAVSGFIGRYAYRRIHWGMFGRLHDVSELRSELLGREDLAEAKFAGYPAVIDVLHQFHAESTRKKLSVFETFLLMFRMPFRRDRVRRAAKALINQEDTNLHQLSTLIDDYAFAIDRYVRFTFYEKIFALWHVLHIPLVYIMFASAIWHVVAVHMY